MIVVLVALSLLFTGGVALAVVPVGAAATRPRGRAAPRRGAARVAAGVVVAGAVVVVSGWVVPGLVVGAGVWWGLGAVQRRSADVEVARLDALASWVESVRDVLMAGEQPVGAINASVGAAHPLVRPAVRRLAAGLSRRDPDVVFRRFADDLDDPLADLVAAGLAIAVRRGARTVPVLTALADQTRGQVDRRRLVEAERAPARREVQALSAIMATLVMGLLLFGRNDYLGAYDSAGGQIFLALALAGYAALIVRVQRLATFPRPGRFLSGAASAAPSPPATGAVR